MSKPILTLDFDGVIHSYKSGWKGASVIPDDPVPGAIEFILNARLIFRVTIHSSRSHQWMGRRAMKKWLKNQLINWFEAAPNDVRFDSKVGFNLSMDVWDDEIEWWAEGVVKSIEWPLFKPPSMVSIDDRAITFNGQWPKLDDLLAFKPWNK